MMVVEICKNIPITTPNTTGTLMPVCSMGTFKPISKPKGVIIPKSNKTNHAIPFRSDVFSNKVIRAIATGI